MTTSTESAEMTDGKDDPLVTQEEPAFELPDHWDWAARMLLLLAVFLSGWSLLRVGQMNLTFSDIALLASVGILGLRGRLSLSPFGPLTPYWIAGLLMMLGGLFVSSIINGDPLRWVNIALQYAVAFLLIPILLMQQDQRMVRIMPVMFVLGITLSEIVGIVAIQTLTLHDTIKYLGDGFITGNQRLGSMTGQPNPNGAVIAFALPMLIYAQHQRTLSRPVAIICWIALIWGLMLTASFTGFFASVVAILCTLTLIGPRHVIRLAIVATLAGSLFMASGVPLPKAFQERVGSALENGDINQAGTFLNRSELIAEAWVVVEKHIVIGMGVDEYRNFSAHDNPVHNLYLLIWNEGGTIALLGLLTLLGLLGVLAAGGLRDDRHKGAMACATVMVLLIYTASYPHMYSRMWVIPVMVALSSIYARHNAVAKTPSPPARSLALG